MLDLILCLDLLKYIPLCALQLASPLLLVDDLVGATESSTPAEKFRRLIDSSPTQKSPKKRASNEHLMRSMRPMSKAVVDGQYLVSQWPNSVDELARQLTNGIYV